MIELVVLRLCVSNPKPDQPYRLNPDFDGLVSMAVLTQGVGVDEKPVAFIDS